MKIGLILIIISTVGFVIAFASVWFVKRNKSTKKAESPKQKVPAEPVKQDKKDDTFKIVRKNKSARVSRKALDSNSRSAKIERVFEREPEPETQPDVEVDVLSTDSEKFINAINAIQNDERKVVSLGELSREIAEQNIKDNSADEMAFEEYAQNKDGESFVDETTEKPQFVSGLKERNSNLNTPPLRTKNLSDVIEMDAILNPKFKNKK